MSFRKKKRASKKNVLNTIIYGKLKRGLAFLMAVILAVSAPLPGMSFSSYADPSITPVNLPINGGGLTTAYKYLQGEDGFDIEGISNPNLIGKPNPYQGGDGSLSISTTFQNSGYATYLSQDGGTTKTKFRYDAKNGGVKSNTAMGLDLQLKLYPSDDKRMIIAEYTVHNRNNAPNSVQLGVRADICLGNRPGASGGKNNPADASKLFITNRGFSMVNSKTQQSYECITDNPDEGLITPPTTRWVGSRTNMMNNIYTDLGTGGSVQDEDSAMTFSWTIPLNAYQTVTKKVGFRVNNASFYVNAAKGSNSNPGTSTAPLQTAEAAIKKIQDDPLNVYKTGVVYFQTDYETASTITVPDGMDITFSSANFDTKGDPATTIYTIKRKTGFDSGPVFQTASGTMRFSRVNLDGKGAVASGSVDASAPLISATGGLVSIQTGTKIQNIKMTNPTTGKGGAIDVSGTGSLSMQSGDISNNKVSDKGAVHFGGTGEFSMQGTVKIDGNTAGYDTKSNVYLEAGTSIKVTGKMGASRVGVDLAEKPALSLEGVPDSPDQEAIVAVPQDDSGETAQSLASVFYSTHPNFYTAVGTNFTGVADHSNSIVLRGNKYQITFKIGVIAGTDPIQNPPAISPIIAGPGESVTSNRAPGPDEITGYKLVSTKITPDTVTTLTADANGVITGTMPGQSVTVEYDYRLLGSSITFHKNGGTPVNPDIWLDKWEGKADLPIEAEKGGEPQLTKTGYTFLGWSLENNGPTSPIIDPFPTQYPRDELDYYAIFKVDPSQLFQLNVKYTNEDESRVLMEDKLPSQNVDSEVKVQTIPIYGYGYKNDSSRTDPDIGGTFFTTGLFTGIMPSQDLTLYYHYGADPSVNYHLTVNYKSEGGTVLADPAQSDHPAEGSVSAAPIPGGIPHYTYSRYQFDKGADPMQREDGSWVYGVKNKPDTSGAWSDQMPNQDVELTYLYAGNQDAASKFDVTEKYVDVTDPGSPKEISSRIANQDVPVDQSVNGQYHPIYGYTQQAFEIAVSGGIKTNIAFGTAGDADKWSGAMPAGDVTVTYQVTRNHNPTPPAKPSWATLTYNRTDNGTLSAGTPDVTEITPGKVYSAEILISDGSTEGDAAAYTWKDLKDKKLIPTAVPDTNYQFDRWYIDENKDGKVDGGDTPLDKGLSTEITPEADSLKITGAQPLLASFEKDPERWIEINFAAENGDLTGGQTKLSVIKDSTWGEIQADQLPTYAAWPHYKENGWWTKDAMSTFTQVDASTQLVGGETYIHRFTPDPADRYDYTVEHTNADGSVIFKTTTNTNSNIIDDIVTADKEAVPGYTWTNDGSSGTNPPSFRFNPHQPPVVIGGFVMNGHFEGRMPGEPLKVTYKYSVDPSRTFNLTVNYKTAAGAEVAPSRKNEPYHAEDRFSAAPETVTGYKYDHFEFVTGKETIGTDGLQKPVVGQPGADGIWTDAVMPNQDVTLNYIYTGDPGKTYTVTEKYVGTGRDGYGVEPISSDVVYDVPADTEVHGSYVTPHGYQFKSSKIKFDPQDPAPVGNDLKFDAGGKNWSGHMPAANVEITYENDRIPDKFVTLTYKPGNNGHIYKLGTTSGNLKPVPGVPGEPDPGAQFYIDVLKDDGSHDPAIPTWKFLKDHQMYPSAAPLSAVSTLYLFEGWFVDTSGDGDRQTDEPLLPDDQTFSADTTLTASFIKNAHNWITINLAAKKGKLADGAPSTLVVPRVSHWADITAQLPDYVPWTNYKKEGWRDASGFLLGDGAAGSGTLNPQLEDGKTYTATCVPDPAVTFPYTVKYTNADESVTFKEVNLQSLPIEAEAKTETTVIPGYEWDSSTGSRAEPAEYNFDKDHPSVMESTGSFDSVSGKFTGKMPGQPLTVYYHYKASAGVEHRYTEKYVDSRSTDPNLRPLKNDVSPLTAPDTVVNGQYKPQYGYSKLSSEIAYRPENPMGADLHFTDEAQTTWTGHMPAADVDITYTLDRIPEKWTSITYREGLNGSLNADGKSGDMQPITDGAPGVRYGVSILKNDGADPLNKPDSWGRIQANGLSPNAVPDDTTLYFSEGWFIDTNDDRVRQEDGSEPLLDNTKTFDAPTVLTASFKENKNAWIDIKFTAEKGDLGAVNPEILHVPAGTTWGSIKDRLPACTPWTNYQFDAWYDGNSPMTDDILLTDGHTYTARSIPDAANMYACKVIYTNMDDTLTFHTEDLGLKKIEDPVPAARIDVPGYIWSKDDSIAEPSSYTDGAGQTVSTGHFDADGTFKDGKMPGEAFTVHYRYKVNPTPPPEETFHLTIRYESEGGATLAVREPETRLPGTEIKEVPKVIAHYTCIGAEPIKGFTEDGAKLPAGKPDATAPYAWNTLMPNQDVELVYRYQGQGGGDPANQFTVTEKYIDVTDPDRPTEISSKTGNPVNVDEITTGRYEQPFGYVPADFTIKADTDGIRPNLAFGYQSDPNQWGGPMPASNVTITYNNTRQPDPTPDDPSDDKWAAMTYKRTDHGTLSRDTQTQPDISETAPGSEYTAQMLVTDGSPQGNAAAWKWSDLKAKKLVPKAEPEDSRYYQFDGWYLDNGDGVLNKETDTLLGKGDNTDTDAANQTIFTGASTLIASFSEITDKWIDISFNAENGTHASGDENMHIQADRLWGNIKNNLPVYTAWPHYADAGWYAGNAKVQDGDLLINGQTYTHKFIPSTAPEDTYTVTKLYTNSDGSITFKTDTSDTTSYHITDPVSAAKIDVPGYVWNKDTSTTDPAVYPFDPTVGGTKVGDFADDGSFTGRMPGGMQDKTLKIIYKYDVAPKPVDPAQYPFKLTIRYESENGGILHDPVIDRPMNANDPISEVPVPVDHYDCNGYRFVKGNQVIGNAQPVAKEPDANQGYAWNTVMPNQDVELVYLYKGKGDAESKFDLTETYMDVTDPANPRQISSSTIQDISVDTVKDGQYTKPYGYDPAQKEDGSGPDFTVEVTTQGIQPDIRFGYQGDNNKWHGAMPASDVEIIYNNIRHTDPQNPDNPDNKWAMMTYQKVGNGTLSRDVQAQPDITEVTPGETYSAQILIADSTQEGKDNAYTWSDLKAKGLVPTAAEDTYYQFEGWYIDKNNNGIVDKGYDEYLGKGDASDTQAANQTYFTGKTQLLANFVEDSKQWVTVTFKPEKGSLAPDNTNPETLHIQADKTWADINPNQVPKYEPWTNYEEDAWYKEGKNGKPDVPMDTIAAEPLENGAVYIHKFKPSAADVHTLTVKHTNMDGSIVFKTVEDPNGYKIEDPINNENTKKIDVPGYVWKEGSTEPENYLFDPAAGAVPIGEFSNGGTFMGKMPGQDLTVIFKYDVAPAPSPEQKPFTLTIRYQSLNGTDLQIPKTEKKNAEEGITESPVPFDHYDYDHYEFLHGNTPEGNSQPVKDMPDAAGVWNTKMPNQDVELIYWYKGKAEDPASRFTITERYMDVTDPDASKLISEDTETYKDTPVDTPVNGGYQQPYGYDPAPNQAGDGYDFTIQRADEAVRTNLAFETGENAGKWSGAMPATNVTITYNNTRHVDPSNPDAPDNKWATLTYRQVGPGTISRDPVAQPDITEVTPSQTYTAQVLISDGTPEGMAHAYKWSDLKAKGLIPAANPKDMYYQFDGWYMDNGDGHFDKETDTPLGKGDVHDTAEQNNRTFDGAKTLYASFEKIGDAWTDIQFKAENGSLVMPSKPETLNVQADRQWGAPEIQNELPSYKPWPSYSEHHSFWYRESDVTETPMEATTPIEKGAVYIHRFVPITNVTDPGDTDHAYTLTVVNESDTGVKLKPDDTQGGKNKRIDQPISAAPIREDELHGYTLIGQSINPDKYAYDGVNEELLEPDHVSFDPTTHALTGRMPGEDLTVTYTYKASENTYKLSAQYWSENGVLLGEDLFDPLKAEEEFTTAPKTIPGYTCGHTEIIQDTTTPGITSIQETPPVDAPFTSHMPNQDITVRYYYTGSTQEADRHNLTVTYIDTGSEDPDLAELPGGSTTAYLPDEAIIDGTFQPPTGYRKDPEKGITINPPEKGIRFTDGSETGWTGFMPNQDVTITCYCQRIPGDPEDPENNYWGDITYEPGAHGTLTKGGTAAWPVSADVKGPNGNGSYTAGILLDNPQGNRPGAYKWSNDIRGRHLVPRPEAETYYTFEGWFEDNNPKNGIRDAGEALIPDDASRTFTGPITLTASFVEDASKWLTLTFAGENVTLTEPGQEIHIPAGRDTWGQVVNQIGIEEWPGYMFDKWTDPSGTVMTNDMTVSTGGVYTLHYIPDPDAKHTYTVQYLSDDGVVSSHLPTEQFEIMHPITARKKEMQGYHWVKGDSGTEPAAYKFDPAGPEVPIGSFNDSGDFTGRMPGVNLTLTYKYAKDPDAVYTLTVLSKIAGTDTTIRTEPVRTMAPGDQYTVTAPVLDGFIYNKTFDIPDGKAVEVGGKITQPVEGEPDGNGSWTFRMPNQNVTLIYYYTVDMSKQYTVTERYIDTEAAAGHQDIMQPQKKQHTAGEPVGELYPDLYGYEKAGTGQLTNNDIEVQGDPWTGATITANPDGSGWSGSMPPRDVTITYKYTRAGYDPDDPNPPDPEESHPWGDIYYLPNAHGSISKAGLSPDIKDYHRDSILPDGATKGEDGYKASILFDNGSAGGLNLPYTFGDIKNKKLLPDAIADPYYTFNGWFVDSNNDGVWDSATEPAFAREAGEGDHYNYTFAIGSTQGEKTLRPRFDETPGAWIDITLKAENTLNPVADLPLHIPFDKKWVNLGPGDGNMNLLPVYDEHDAMINYVPGDWYDTTDPANYIKMEPEAGILNGHTYTYIYKQDPEIFGTDVSMPEVSGGLDGLGKGKITLYDTDKEKTNYNYILTDLNGTILEVYSRVSRAQRVEFDGLQLEGRYNVYEALPEVPARPDVNIQDLGPIGGDEPKISEPAQVLVPVLADNYQVYYNDVTGEDTSVKLVIFQPDPDSDYAVLDSNGQAVPVPGSQEGGWISLSGSASTIQLSGLLYGADYTVVARPKGRTDITAEDQRADGSLITAEPVGELNLKDYILKTTAGEIAAVGETAVGDDYYAGPIQGQTVTLSAPGSNGEGSFIRWEVSIGSSKDLKKPENPGSSLNDEDFKNPDLTFIMPKENLVMTPIYEHDPRPNASVIDEVRGGNKNKIALDPNLIPAIESSLTLQKDKDLWHDNQADVTYKVIYKKGGVKANESDWIKKHEFPQEHLDAYHAAWGLEVSVERYVNGRNVPATASDAQPAAQATAADAALAASPSSAAGETVQFDGAPPVYTTYIQMDDADVDMLDYQLYQITTNAAGEVESAVPVPLIPVSSLDEIDPDHVDGDIAEQNGGLFAFEATVGSRYVMVYSRAYHLYFTNELPLPPFLEHPVYYDFKVRQNEAPSSGEYTEEYGRIPEPEGDDAHIVRNETGAEYIYQGWSYDRDKTDHPRMFDPSRSIKNTTKVYAYYSNNEKQVAEERRLLDEAIKGAQKLSRDPFLKRQDSEKLKEDIEAALEVFNQENPRALEKELKDAREELQKRMKHYQELIQATQDEYEEIQDHNGGGGSSGGGGGGSGIKSDPYEATPARNYTVGNNGDWKLVSEVPGQPKQWAFVINGGMMLRSTWAYLTYPDVTNAATGWYHFNGNAIMDTGWYQDEAGKWYYSSKEGEGPEGRMATGWHLDGADGNWYYLDPSSGAMVTGWRQIDGKWYYMETVGAGAYVYDAVTGQWNYSGQAAGHPLGAMYKNEKTPDGYMVDANGARIR